MAGASGVSRRLLPKADPKLYRINKLVSPQNVLLENIDTNSTQLGFAQPVHISRLISFDLQELQAPVDSAAPLCLEMVVGGAWLKGEITKQNATGAVFVKFENGSESVHRLEREEYRWIHGSDLDA